MAKLKLVPSPPPPPEVEDEDEQDCPKCPSVGAPAWMATFADMATLLMAFFVLILSFANFDEVAVGKMSGAMRDRFGTKIVDIGPFPENSMIIEMQAPPASNPPTPDGTQEPEKGEKETPPDPALQDLTEILQEALKDGEITVTGDDGTVTVRLPEGAGAGDLAKAIAGAASDIAGQAGDASGEGTAPGADAAQKPGDAEGGEPKPDDASSVGDGGAAATRRASIAESRLKVALREIEGEGLVDVQQQDDKVIVTVGSGGAFGSGSAELTDEAREIMSRIALSATAGGGQITVTGHTDDVPLTGGPLVDNWGLAAARASSVVRELAQTGGVDPSRMTAVSKGDSSPVADNSTEEGRLKNRRVEIVFDFGEPAP